MNRVFAFLIFLISIPFLLVIAFLLVLIDNQNPLFFQERLGKGRVPFQLIKLRTMKDGRITVIGKILRKTGIDEIPQMINIIKGDMNFIGPRPLMQSDVIRLGWENERYDMRWGCKPGLTGLAQLSLMCHRRISFFYDVYYVNNRSFAMDIYIISMSCLVVFFGKDVVKVFGSKLFNKKR